MEEKRLLSKDEVYFFSIFFLILLLDQSYCLAGITLIQYVHFFIFAGEDPFPFTLFFIVFFCCLYYLFKILIKKYPLRNFIKSNDV